MTKRAWVIGVALVVALAAGAVATRDNWSTPGAVAQSPRGQQDPRVFPVEVVTAIKTPVPVRIDALGTVTPVASVALKARIETTIVGVHFADGAQVKAGDLLFTLDGRTIEAQIKQVEGILSSAKAQLEQAERDVQRYTELVARNATTQVTLSNARTQANMARAAVESNSGQLENLKVQLSYTRIHAPISGRASMAAVKVGNFVRPSDTAPLATINQIAPIYISFAVPQRVLGDVREAIAEGTPKVEASIPGDHKRAVGRIAMIENAVDATTGMVVIRAIIDNADEMLWPGALVSTQLILREEQAVTVPSRAVQVSQTGNFVFVVKDNVARVQPVKVARTVESISVIAEGLAGGESVVIDGQLLLSNGARVAPRAVTAGS